MKRKLKVFAISGSTRIDSTNESILKLIAEQFSKVAELEIFKQLSLLPHFNPDMKGDNVPDIVKDFLNKIEHADGVFICTPEYVFSLPGSLKNALEWCVAATVFSDKPVGFIVASGLGDKAFESLDLILSTLVQSPVPADCMLLISGGRSVINKERKLNNEIVAGKLKATFQAFLNKIPNL